MLKIKKTILFVIIMILGLCACSTEAINENDIQTYSRAETKNMSKSQIFGIRKKDDIYVSLDYIYSDKDIKEKHGSDFEITENDVSCIYSSAQKTSFNAFCDGEAVYCITVDDNNYIVSLLKKAFKPWTVTECEFEVSKKPDEYFKVKDTEKKLPLKLARDCYVSSSVLDIIYPPHDYVPATFMIYKHDTVALNKYTDCCIFDIEGNDNLKFYAYFDKKSCINAPMFFQSLIVDESIIDCEISFNIGDNLEKVKTVYPNVNVFKSSLSIILDEEADENDVITDYFEIMDKNGVYTYFLKKDGVIYYKEKIILELWPDE